MMFISSKKGISVVAGLSMLLLLSVSSFIILQEWVYSYESSIMAEFYRGDSYEVKSLKNSSVEIYSQSDVYLNDILVYNKSTDLVCNNSNIGLDVGDNKIDLNDISSGVCDLEKGEYYELMFDLNVGGHYSTYRVVS